VDIKSNNYLFEASCFLLGVLIPLIVFIYNRSLTIDESNLARNIIEKGIPQFFQPLDYEQFAPPLYSASLKVFSSLLGNYDWVFKLMSILPYALMILLMIQLLKKLKLSKITIVLAIILISFSPLFIRYSTELKQYSLDGCIALGLIFFAMMSSFRIKDKNEMIVWGIVGGLCVWFSMPSVFILFGIGLAMLFSNNKSRTSIILICTSCLIWLLQFIFYYILILREDALREGLQDTHAKFFFNLTPSSWSEISQNINLINGLLDTVGDHTLISSIAVLGLVLWGGYKLQKTYRKLFIAIFVPLVTMIITSGLELYSLIPRMTYFCIPLFFIFIAVGLDTLWNLNQRVIKFGIISIVGLMLINKEGYKHIYHPMEIEDSKSAIRILEKQNINNDPIIVDADGTPAFYYYNNLSDRKLNLPNNFLCKWNEEPIDLKNQYVHHDTYWVFLAHTFPEEKIERFKRELMESDSLIHSWHFEQAHLWKFERGNLK